MKKCMKCGGTTKMAKGGSIMNKPAMKKQPVNLYGIPQENTGTSGQYGLMKKGGAVKKALPKAQDGKTVKKVGPNKYAKDQVIVNKKDGSSASYVATNNGTVYSTKNKKNGPADVLSIDTTGYSKGKPNYDQIYTGSAGYNKSTVKRKDVKPLLKSMKKETLSLKTGGTIKKMAKGGPVNKELKARGEELYALGTISKDQGAGMKYSGQALKNRGLGMKAKGMALKEKGKTIKSEGRTLKAAGQILDRMKSGGSTKNSKLAALAAPKNKITRADVIVGAKRNAKKK